MTGKEMKRLRTRAFITQRELAAKLGFPKPRMISLMERANNGSLDLTPIAHIIRNAIASIKEERQRGADEVIRLLMNLAEASRK